jgi:hypothetical protein
MPYLADRVQETATTTGTGAVTLAGAVVGFRSFAVGFAGHLPSTIPYLIVSGNNWEVGRGTLNSTATTLTRDTVKSSSSAGALITLAGTSNVYCTVTAETLDNASVGMQYAQQRGMALC